jgi:Sigma-54 interaction domain
VSPLRSEFRLLQTVSARGCHPNVLIVCEDHLVDVVVARVARWSRRPLHSCTADDWRLPTQAGGTLVLKDLWSLSNAQQSALFEWMNVNGEATQVVSVARPGLQALVEGGDFLEALFFRLNVLQIEISCRQTDAARLEMAG